MCRHKHCIGNLNTQKERVEMYTKLSLMLARQKHRNRSISTPTVFSRVCKLRYKELYAPASNQPVGLHNENFLYTISGIHLVLL